MDVKVAILHKTEGVMNLTVTKSDLLDFQDFWNSPGHQRFVIKHSDGVFFFKAEDIFDIKCEEK